MKKFEVGKTYTGGRIEIKVIKRTEKQITFIYTGKNWWQLNIEKQYRKKIFTCLKEHEAIYLGNHWSSPYITAS